MSTDGSKIYFQVTKIDTTSQLCFYDISGLSVHWMFTGTSPINFFLLVNTNRILVIDKQSNKGHFRLVIPLIGDTVWGTSMDCPGGVWTMSKSGK